jgi:uncharacterized membrane protein
MQLLTFGVCNSKSRHNVNLWTVPLKMSLASVLLFAFTVTLDTLSARGVIHIPDWFTMGGIDDARAILAAMLGCVSTVLALIFSVALLVLSMVANLFGPRLLYRFVQDWVTQTTIGFFMGAFIYVFLIFLVTHKDAHSEFVPQVSLITSWFVVLGAFAFLVFYSHRVAELIQNPDAIGRIVDDLRRAAYLRNPGAQSVDPRHRVPPGALGPQMTDIGVVYGGASGYLQEIYHERLVSAAHQAEATIQLLFRPGQFVLEGQPLAYVSPASKSAEFADTIERNIHLGRHRVLAQDLEFGVAQIVEISIRALSPAINDTFTGIACVDLLGEALTILEAAPSCSGRWYDSHGTLRLLVRPVIVPRLVKQAFDQIRQAAADNPAVLIRLLSTIGRLAGSWRIAADRTALREQAFAVWETANSRVAVTMDRDDIEAAWRKTRDLLTDADVELQGSIQGPQGPQGA